MPRSKTDGPRHPAAAAAWAEAVGVPRHFDLTGCEHGWRSTCAWRGSSRNGVDQSPAFERLAPVAIQRGGFRAKGGADEAGTDALNERLLACQCQRQHLHLAHPGSTAICPAAGDRDLHTTETHVRQAWVSSQKPHTSCTHHTKRALHTQGTCLALLLVARSSRRARAGGLSPAP